MFEIVDIGPSACRVIIPSFGKRGIGRVPAGKANRPVASSYVASISWKGMFLPPEVLGDMHD